MPWWRFLVIENFLQQYLKKFWQRFPQFSELWEGTQKSDFLDKLHLKTWILPFQWRPGRIQVEFVLQIDICKRCTVSSVWCKVDSTGWSIHTSWSILHLRYILGIGFMPKYTSAMEIDCYFNVNLTLKLRNENREQIVRNVMKRGCNFNSNLTLKLRTGSALNN